MFGPNFTNSNGDINEGMIPRAVNQVFQEIDTLYKTTMMEFTVYWTFLQIYNEKLYDLLQDGKRENPLVIREDKYSGTFVEGCSEYVITTPQDCLYLLERGEFNRITRQTKSNVASSRSHSLFQLWVESINPSNNGKLIRAKLNLWDLAGSEKIYSEERIGEKQMEELKNINLSLSTLGKVVGALSKNKTLKHIPFRESKLTRLLKDSLGGKLILLYYLGNTSTILIGTISPLDIHTDESISTMKFADRAMKIQVKAQANEINPEDDILVQKLRREVIHLKEILQLRRNKTQKDINIELLNLKEENSRLKQMNSATEEVERLRKENKQLRLMVQENQNYTIEADKPVDQKSIWYEEVKNEDMDPFDLVTPNEDYLAGDAKPKIDENPYQENAESMDKENNQMNWNREGSFFITETASERERKVEKSKKNIKPPLPNIMDVLSDSKARETVLSTSKKDDNESTMKKEKPLMITNFGKEDSKLFDKNPDLTPTTLHRDFGSRQTNTTDPTVNKRNFGLHEIKNAAEGLKQEMVVQNRCNIWTLKLPCKHFSTFEEMRDSISSNKKKSISEAPKDHPVLPPLPRIQSMGAPKRKTLPSWNTEIIANMTEDSSFHSNYLWRDQISIFKDSSMIEPKLSAASRTTGMRTAPQDDSTWMIRIRTKNNLETFKGNVKRTVSEHRATKRQKTKMKEARKRLETLEKIEQYRKKKMENELIQMEVQARLSEEYRKVQMKKQVLFLIFYINREKEKNVEGR